MKSNLSMAQTHNSRKDMQTAYQYAFSSAENSGINTRRLAKTKAEGDMRAGGIFPEGPEIIFPKGRRTGHTDGRMPYKADRFWRDRVWTSPKKNTRISDERSIKLQGEGRRLPGPRDPAGRIHFRNRPDFLYDRVCMFWAAHTSKVMRRDFATAFDIQQSLLPHVYPNIPGYNFYGMNKPCQYIGGDLYDFIQIDTHHILFNIADVAGTGISAALLMTCLTSDFRMEAQTSQDLNILMSRLNDNLVDRNSRGLFVTMLAGLLDTRTGLVQYVNAGHPPFLLRHPNGSLEIFRQPGGPPLGIVKDIPMDIGTFQINPGDTLLLYTDGITERMDNEGRLFGLTGLEKSFAQPFTTPMELTRRILNDMASFAGENHYQDDVTIALIQRNN